MTPRSISQYLCIVATIVLGCLLFACVHSASDSAQDLGDVVCDSSSENIAVCFFAGAYLQGGDGPVEPIRDAIEDALTLPLEELRAKRYPNYAMEPNQWTFEEIIWAYFIPGSRMKNGDIVTPRSDGFIEAVKQPKAIPVLKKIQAEMEEAIRQYESGD